MINTNKLESILTNFSNDIDGITVERSVFIGEINGKPVQITVMSKSEAQIEHDYEGTRPEYDCFEN